MMYRRYYWKEFIAAPTDCKVDWEGWDASFIEIQSSKTKRKAPPIDYDAKRSEDDIAKKKAKVGGKHMAEYMCIDGALICEQEMKDSCEVEVHPELKVLRHFSWLDIIKDSCSERNSFIGKAATYFTQSVVNHINWKLFESCLPQHVTEKLRKDVTSSIAKVVLTIFDPEDFANAYVSRERHDNYVKLLARYKYSCEVDSFRERLDEIKKAEKLTLRTIAEDMDKNLFAELVEADICSLISFDFIADCSEDEVDSMLLCGNKVSCAISSRPKDSDKFDPRMILKEMETYVPLKGRYKAQLTLELAHWQHYHILDSLFVEACMGCMSTELFVAVKEKLGANAIKAPLCLAHNLADPMLRGVYDMGRMKLDMLRVCEGNATMAFDRGAFGRFSKDVYKVIYVAEYERRKLGHRFIGVDGILVGLSISRVCHHPLVESVIVGSSSAEPPEIPPHRIYKLAGEYASQFGSETVELEHLVLAVYCVKKGEQGKRWSRGDLESLQKMNVPFVDGWKEEGLLIDGLEISSDCVDLVKGVMERSIKLPPIRRESS